jgi:AcrR family transcriptional regulator
MVPVTDDFGKTSDQTLTPGPAHPVGRPGRRYRDRSLPERRAERRARLIDAATDAFGTDGYQSTSIEQLCQAAGISTRNFYEEFSGREELLATLHDNLNHRALEAVTGAIAETDPLDIEARAAAGVSAYFKVMTSDARLARIALVESVGVSAELEAHRHAAYGQFASLIQSEADRLARHELIPTRDYSLTAVALVGAIQALINTWTTDNDWDSTLLDVKNEATQIVVSSLRATDRGGK